MCLASLRLVIFHEPFCKFTRKYHSSWSLEFAPRPERVERVVASPKRIPPSVEMKSFLYAAIVILQVTTSFCEMRKTIKVLKFPQIGKFGGFSKPVGHYDFEPGDQKEATICMKFRTFAYNEGFGCPFLWLHILTCLLKLRTNSFGFTVSAGKLGWRRTTTNKLERPSSLFHTTTRQTGRKPSSRWRRLGGTSTCTRTGWTCSSGRAFAIPSA